MNQNITAHTTWGLVNNNCSTFASLIWNSVATEDEKVDAGMLNMPGNLVGSIKKVGANVSWSLYAEGYRVPFDYPTYYGNPPIRKNPTFDNSSSSS
ncbi:hypothetical protein [Bifidobacterium choerinum]|uniref:hypothetical protein n=1 Tax=Bifidobacterium choerinum TaxID=35760 RepID=UPI001269C2EA|nr:hypothetical protein [Bifidobacterium choerinum]